MSVYHDIRAMGISDRRYGTPTQELNRQIAMYSRKLAANSTKKRTADLPEARVAVSDPIYRAYISPCWNCKHCWNSKYDCRSTSLAAAPRQDRIRGPGGCVDLNKYTKEFFTYG